MGSLVATTYHHHLNELEWTTTPEDIDGIWMVRWTTEFPDYHYRPSLHVGRPYTHARGWVEWCRMIGIQQKENQKENNA